MQGWEHEAGLIAASHRGPVTVELLADDLAALGVRAGSALIVHSSMRTLGWVCGGTQAVVLALREVLGEQGTLVVPTHTGLSDPAGWTKPPVPEGWVETLRSATPAYDPATTPTRGMGAVADAVRSWPGACRSGHPEVPFAALGPAAGGLTAGQALDSPLGERSPIARLYDLEGWVLLLGVGHGNNTTLHLAEERAEWPRKRRRRAGAPLVVDGERRWVTWEQLDYDDADFPELGSAFEAGHPDLVGLGRVGHADARLLPVRPLVDFGARWIATSRSRAHVEDTAPVEDVR